MNANVTVAQRRRLPQLSDIGSPSKLYTLVSELAVRDDEFARNQALKEKGASKLRSDFEAASLRHLEYYLGLLLVGSVQRHFLKALGLSTSDNQVLSRIDSATAGEQKLANASLDAVVMTLQPNYAARIMAGRKAELEGSAYNYEFFDPMEDPVGESAFEIYRRGTLLEAAGNNDGAEAMYSRAIAASPRFSLALRSYARLVAQRDPSQAAACFGAALDDMPRLVYGQLDTHFFGGRLQSETRYRNFRILTLNDEAIAVPALAEATDFSNPTQRTRLNRFLGLMLLRVRLNIRRSYAAGKTSASLPTARVSLMTRIKNTMRPYNRFYAPVSRFRVKHPIDVKSSAGWLRGRIIRSFRARARGMALRVFGTHKARFDFVLADENSDRLKRQIDVVYDRWLDNAAR